jgi:hypothetical protein
MNKEQQEIIGEVYKNYVNKTKFPGGDTVPKIEFMYPDSTILTQEKFINKIKTDNEFSEKWGLKIEERELNRKERSEYYYKHGNSEGIVEGSLDRPIFEEDEVAHKWYDERNVPTKLITITYNDKTIESYE